MVIPIALIAQLIKIKKKKHIFLTCPCHKIYMAEEVGLQNSNCTQKITILGGNDKLSASSSKIDIISIFGLSKFEYKKFFCAYVTNDCIYLPNIKFCFYLINFQLKIDFPS